MYLRLKEAKLGLIEAYDASAAFEASEGTRASLHLPCLLCILCSELLASFTKTAGTTLCGALGAFLLP